MPDTSRSDEADQKDPSPRSGRVTLGGVPRERRTAFERRTHAILRTHPLLSTIAAGLILALLAGCLIRVSLGRSPNAPEVVKLGLIAPFEGPSRPLGYAVLQAVRLRLQRWNEGGGVPRVELVALNDDGDPALAARLPGQLALDPEVLLVLGPPQGQTALAALPGFQAHALPAISLAPLPDASTLAPPTALGPSGAQGHLGTVVVPFAGTAETVRLALAGQAPGAVVAWRTQYPGPLTQSTRQMPITTTTIWVGDPQTLAFLIRSQPSLVPAAGAVAAEEAFAARAGAAADGLVWATAYPESLPADFASTYQQETGAPPEPTAALAYAAADEALKLLNLHRSRAGILAALDSIDLPPMRLFVRQGSDCCLPLSSQP